MKITKTIDEELTISYDHDDKTKEAVYQAVMDWYIKHQAFDGEVIMQSDETIIDAPALLSKIADEILKFEVQYNDDE